jgi:hypothetical protein
MAHQGWKRVPAITTLRSKTNYWDQRQLRFRFASFNWRNASPEENSKLLDGRNAFEMAPPRNLSLIS